MIKIAKLINGDVICGEIIETPGIERWGYLLFVQLVPQKEGKAGMQFIPVVQFGNFNESIVIKDEQIVYSYVPNSEFVKTYRQAQAKYQTALNKTRQKGESNIVAPTTAEIIDIVSHKR